MTLSDVTSKAHQLEADVKGSLGEHAGALESLQGDYTPINMTRALQLGLKEFGSKYNLLLYICDVCYIFCGA